MVFEYVLLAVLLVAAIFIVIAVVLSPTSDEGLSGTIAGGAETFFGKQKGKTIDKKLSKITAIVAVVFVILVLVVYIIQDQTDYDKLYDSLSDWYSTSSDSTDDTTADGTGDETKDTTEDTTEDTPAGA